MGKLRTLLMLLLCMFVYHTQAQVVTVTTDPTSMAQRLTLFLEQMDESLVQGAKLSAQIETAEKTLQLARESKEKLQKVSQFIKTASVVVQITESGARLIGKVDDYRQLLSKSDFFSEEEKYTLLDQIVTLGNVAADKVKEGLALTKDNCSDGEFNDYERLQLLSQIRNEVESVEDGIDKLYQRAVSGKTHRQFVESFTRMTVNTMTSTSSAIDYVISSK